MKLDEKFIRLITKEPFDYTQWQTTLWKDETVEQVSETGKTKEIKSQSFTNARNQSDTHLAKQILSPQSVAGLVRPSAGCRHTWPQTLFPEK